MTTGSLLEPSPLKWTYIFRLADDADARQWHLEEWPKSLLQVPGVRRVVIHDSLQAPQPDDVSRPLNDYDGLVEVHLGDASALDEVLPLVKGELGPRFAVVRGMVSTLEEDYDLRRHVPAQQHPYLAETIDWKNTPPPADEPAGDADLWRYVYFFRYRDDVPWVEGEDWYLGHHTREGRQLPGLRRYVTWRRRRVDALSAEDAEVFNGSARYTELCFDDFEAWHRATHSNGPRWRMDERHPTGVWTDYQQLFIGVTPVVDAAAH